MVLFYSEKNNTSENVDFRGKQLENPWDYNDKIFSVLFLYEHEHNFSGIFISALVHLQCWILCCIFFANYILLLDWPLLFQKCFYLFFQKRIFSTYSASIIFGNMQSALLVCKSLQIFSCMVAKTSFTSNVTFLELFLLVKCLHINLMYWRQNTDLDIT